MIHMERMDGQIGSDVHNALLKAQASLRLREPTSIRGNQMRNTNRDVARNVTSNGFNLFLATGGIPIVVDSQMIGAVGVSGLVSGTEGSKDDEDCAAAGLKAAFGDRALVPVYGAAGAGRGGEGR